LLHGVIYAGFSQVHRICVRIGHDIAGKGIGETVAAMISRMHPKSPTVAKIHVAEIERGRTRRHAMEARAATKSERSDAGRYSVNSRAKFVRAKMAFGLSGQNQKNGNKANRESEEWMYAEIPGTHIRLLIYS
jgi:hypothetical protein